MDTTKLVENKCSSLFLGNQALRNGAYETAINYFYAAAKETPALKSQIEFNIALAKKYAERHGILQEKQPTRKEKSLINVPALPKYDYQFKIERLSEQNVTGWAVNSELPSEIFELSIIVNGVEFTKIKNDKPRKDLMRYKKSEGLGGFSLTFPKGLFETGLNKISIRLPSGECLDGGIIEVNTKQIINDWPFIQHERTVSIIVPIYNAIDDVKKCIERLRKYTKSSIRIFLINDASSDPAIKKYLNESNKDERFIIIHNEKNLGFTKTVNKGIKLAENDDIVLLNSDARVTPRWLEGMQRALATDSRIATVTPMSDRAGAFSAPNIGNENDLPLGVIEIKYALAFRRRARGLYPSVPTGNGFCMYIRRACMNEVGILDEEAFPRGYGEENDFCMRARSQGWRHVVDDRTYVFHDRSKSFAEEKNHLIEAGRKVIDERYPDYKKAITVFSRSPLLALARFSAKQAIADCLESEGIKPRALFVVATKTGGTPQTNRDLMLALYESWEPWLLHCDSKTLSLYKVHSDKNDTLMRQHELNEPIEPLSHISYEYDRVVATWLSDYDFDLVHIRHLAWHSLNLPKIAKFVGCRVVNSFHDFYAICPTVKLLDEKEKFCNGQCTTSIGDCVIDLWSDKSALPPLKSKWIHQWRKKFQESLKYCDAFVTTHESVKKTITSYLDIDKEKFHVIPHGRDFKEFYKLSDEINDKDNKPLKILVPGNIGNAKGSEIIKKLLELDADEKLHFHILGKTTLNIAHPRLTVHGEYKRDEFSEKVRSIRPHVGAVFSIWNETWCHTLTELWSVGIPAIVLDYETVSNRVKESGCGWTISHSEAHKIYDEIISITRNSSNFKEKLENIDKWQNNYIGKNCQAMAEKYNYIYSTLL